MGIFTVEARSFQENDAVYTGLSCYERLDKVLMKNNIDSKHQTVILKPNSLTIS